MTKRRPYRLESKRQPLLSRRAFAGRLAASFGVATAFIAVSLLAGVAGYHYLEGMAWIDAYANASMILSGMGPLGPPKTLFKLPAGDGSFSPSAHGNEFVVQELPFAKGQTLRVLTNWEKRLSK